MQADIALASQTATYPSLNWTAAEEFNTSRGGRDGRWMVLVVGTAMIEITGWVKGPPEGCKTDAGVMRRGYV